MIEIMTKGPEEGEHNEVRASDLEACKRQMRVRNNYNVTRKRIAWYRRHREIASPIIVAAEQLTDYKVGMWRAQEHHDATFDSGMGAREIWRVVIEKNAR